MSKKREIPPTTDRLLHPSLGHTFLAVLGIAILIALFQLSHINFLLFHSITELVSIGIMWAIFILVWNTRATIENQSIFLLGVAFLFVGAMDLLHTLSYKGMGVFPANDPNIPTQLWIASRYLQSFSMLAAPFLLHRPIKPLPTLLLFAGITTILLTVIFNGTFPDCFLQDTGLTPFKIYSEYFIIVILLMTMVMFYRQRKWFDSQILRFILLSIMASICSELFFTFYVSVYGLSNFIGHCFKIIAVFCLYKAVIEIGIATPFRLFFHKLKTKEQALEVSEDRFRRMFAEHDVIMLQILPETGAILEANQAAVHFYGYSSEQLCRMTIHQLNVLSPEEIAHSKAIAFKGKQSFFTFPHRIANGEIKTVEVHSTPIPSKEGGILFSVIHDVSERKKAELQLNEFFEQPIVINLIMGLDGIIHRVNKSWQTLLGYSAHELVGKNIIDFIHPDDCPASLNEISKLAEGKTTLHFENQFCHKDGSYRLLLWSASASRNEQLIYATSIDITERKRAEEEFKKLTTQLQQAQKMEAIGTLAGGIAHDFNNILGAILGYAEMASDGTPKNSTVHHDIDQIMQAGFRARDLVKQILDFSRQSETDLIPLQPAKTIKEAINLLRSSLPATITIKQNIDMNAGIILADPTQLHQIVINLCTNAFHAMEMHAGTLTVGLQKTEVGAHENGTKASLKPGDYVTLSIRDTGAGISPEIREKMFDPYFTTKEVGKGTGMGLATIHGIVQSIGGAITCESILGEGSIFYVTLPIVERQSREENIKTGPIRSGSEHILLVDDETMLVEMGKVMLERLGYQVTAKTSSTEALRLFQNQPDKFALVITDQTMPDLTGVEMAERMLQLRPQLPIILCTGYSSIVSSKQAISTGIKAFAHKPLTRQEITEKIKEVLNNVPADKSMPTP